MVRIKKGQAKIVARARLMQLLGEQLITDEVAAISELVKNSFDADASQVTVVLDHVSEPQTGYITIRDDGHGMSYDTLMSSWLELGTLSKARNPNLPPRYSESGRRVSLGEKGLGRLAVHKLGLFTEIVTKRANSDIETKLILNWTDFENTDKFLEDIPIEWEITDPQLFNKSESGTQIIIKRLQRKWNKNLVEKVQRNIKSIISPFEKIDFDIIINVYDKIATETDIPNMKDIIDKATYAFEGVIDKSGKIKYSYHFYRPDIVEIKRDKIDFIKDIKNPSYFTEEKVPSCGSFSVKLYSWDPRAADLRAVFGDTAIYRQMIRPNAGVKVFRDNFRVFPYGNQDNDWMGMDARRVSQFELRISRNQVIGAIEIDSESNPKLLDKTDREGLIDNDEFRDFLSLIISALAEFEAERYIDRRKLKEMTGRTRDELTDRVIFTRNLTALSALINEHKEIDEETKKKINELISETRETLESLIDEKEEPLLVAASIGLTYMMPIHEVRRELQQALIILRNIEKTKKMSLDEIKSAVLHIKQADLSVGGLGKIMQKRPRGETFRIEKAVEEAIELMRYRLERNNIDYKIDVKTSLIVKGSIRLITILLINFIDNSIYWLLRNKAENRKIKLVTDIYENSGIITVSDNGPGFQDTDINLLTLPFFTRKPSGMGLGLYIADRIARTNEGKLVLLDKDELPGLYQGANIALILSKGERKK